MDNIKKEGKCMNTLQGQIEQASRSIFTDSYSMSIGELMSMYRENEIDVHPEFQRAFRWETDQKSALIESILLGIPIPPIFIFHRQDGIWDVIDGQQRLSTIFQFAGMYRDEQGNPQQKIQLLKTKFLPALEGIVWEDENPDVYQLTLPQRLLIKRAKIDIKLLKATSDANAKYDLFQRLNSGGSHLTPQEVRTCLIIMENKSFYDKLLQMSNDSDFSATLPLTERAQKEQEDLEFVIRFIVARHCSTESLPSSLHEHLDNSIIALIRDRDFNIDSEAAIFRRTFALLNKRFGSDSFKRYNQEKDVFEGATTISAFEAMTPAISKRIDYYEELPEETFKAKLIQMHTHPNYTQAAARRSTDRFKALIGIGEEIFHVD